jgi:hypothetical protein
MFLLNLLFHRYKVFFEKNNKENKWTVAVCNKKGKPIKKNITKYLKSFSYNNTKIYDNGNHLTITLYGRFLEFSNIRKNENTPLIFYTKNNTLIVYADKCVDYTCISDKKI